MLDKDSKVKASATLVIATPIVSWFIAAKTLYGFTPDNARERVGQLVKYTPDLWPLWGALLVGGIAGCVFAWLVFKLNKSVFKGDSYKQFLRGTQLTTQQKLSRETKERKKEQITLANVPIPTKVETTHFGIGGRVGSGKTTLLKEMMYGALRRGDRMIILDSDGEFVKTFFKKGDVLLNPYDARSAHWSFFNEIRDDYDYERYAKSVIQKSKSGESEEWNNFGRMLFKEVARKVAATRRNPSMEEVFEWTNKKPLEELEAFVQGTDAAAIFTGHERATSSVRFVLSNKIPPHLKMPEGDFSLNDWVNNPNAGNLFITWNEQMKESLTPLIACWVDTLFDQIVALPDSRTRRIWTFLDELESLGQLPTLYKALTRGRSKGLRVVAGYHSFSQIVEVYGEQMARTMMSVLSTSVVLGVGRGGADTAEFMSKTLGEHEVKREKKGESRKWGSMSTKSLNSEVKRERVVMPSEIMALDDLHGYLALPGSLPVASIEFESVTYRRSNPVEAYVPAERGLGD